MFGKITGASIKNAFNNVKGHIVKGYHTTKNILGTVDDVFSLFKKSYGVLAPLLNEVSGNRINSPIMKLIDNYDNIKQKVVEHHDKGENYYNQIKRKVGADFQKIGARI